jgi:hypothetical protein
MACLRLRGSSSIFSGSERIKGGEILDKQYKAVLPIFESPTGALVLPGSAVLNGDLEIQERNPIRSEL